MRYCNVVLEWCTSNVKIIIVNQNKNKIKNYKKQTNNQTKPIIVYTIRGRSFDQKRNLFRDHEFTNYFS